MSYKDREILNLIIVLLKINEYNVLFIYMLAIEYEEIKNLYSQKGKDFCIKICKFI